MHKLTPLPIRLKAVRDSILADTDHFDYAVPDLVCGCIHRTVRVVYNTNADRFFQGMEDADLVWLLLPGYSKHNPDYVPVYNMQFYDMTELPDRGLAEVLKRIDYLITKYSKDISDEQIQNEPST